MSYEMLLKEAQSLTYNETISFISELLEKLKKTSNNSQKTKTKRSCRGIAHEYANVNLISQEEKFASLSFSGAKNDFD